MYELSRVCFGGMGREDAMKIKICCKCKAMTFLFMGRDKSAAIPVLGGSFCGCPFGPMKSREHFTNDGVLVIWDKEFPA